MTDHDSETTTEAPSATTAESATTTGESTTTTGESAATAGESAASAGQSTTTAGEDTDGLSGERVLRAMEYAALAGLSFLALIAVIGAYVSASGAIDVWVDDRFRPIFHTVFNLVVLGLVGIGISQIVRRRFDV